MAFSVKKGDIVYAADETLGFVTDVYLPDDRRSDDGWAAVEVLGIDGVVYFSSADVRTRDESVPSVLLRLTYAEATAEDRRHQPEPITRGAAHAQATPLLEVGRPEVPEQGTPHPDAVRDWPGSAGATPDGSSPT